MKQLKTDMKRCIICLFSLLLGICSCESVRPDLAGEGDVFLNLGASSTLSAGQNAWLSDLNDFSFSYADKVGAGMEESYVVSPVSMGFLLGLISNGVDEITQEEVARALGFGADSKQSVNEFYRDLLVILSTGDDNLPMVELANAVFHDPGLSPVAAFRKNLRNYYDAEFVSVDFSRPQTVMETINSWSARKTHNTIREVIKDLNPAIRAVLVNSAYFKAAWMYPFLPEATQEGVFSPEHGDKRKVPMMHSQLASVSYKAGEGFSMVSLPFLSADRQKEAYSMEILLPNAGVSVSTVLRSLTGKNWKDTRAAMKPVPVDLKIPKFEVETEQNMKETLASMGIKRLFADADYSYMWSPATSLSTIKQSVMISVDEKGAEAAGVSVAYMETVNGPVDGVKEFHADRPFLFAITENSTGAILFLGIYK